tara:strand:+ start:1530 stop:1934 length:405 start_codon:yes stop_codon:yes gene_type:complete
MYCIVWRHYKSAGITPYVVSKYPDQLEADRQPELQDKVKLRSTLRPKGLYKSMGGKENIKLGVFYQEQIANGNVVDQKTIDLDYNTIEDILVFKDKQASDLYLQFLSEIDWTSGYHTIVMQKEIANLKELLAFQ